jgi:hypothetical protein
MGQIALEEVLLLIKLATPEDTRAIRRARALADSLLRQHASGLDLEPGGLAVAAALLGRVHLSAQLTRAAVRGDPLHADIRRSLSAEAEALMVYAALGGPADSATAHEDRIDEAIRNRLPPEEHQEERYELLGHAASVAFPHHLLGRSHELTQNGPYPLLHAQAAWRSADSAAARKILMDLQAARRHGRSAQRALDAIYPEAALWVALGDTAAAVRILDSTLDTLRWSEPRSLAYVDRIAALIWAAVLRADLAAAAGDTDVAARWATPVTILWADADRHLQPVVNRMRRLAETGRRRVSPSSR